jgi:hypothetical protein
MAGRTQRRLVMLLATGVLALGLGAAWPAPAMACRPIPVPFQRIVEDAKQIFLVTVAQRSMAGNVPQAYALVVREALRGALPDRVSLPATVRIDAPVINACGDQLDVRITTHLVLALDVPAFAGGEPITVPWRLLPDGTLEGGHDDGPATWRDLDALRSALAGEAFATPDPTRAPVAAPVPDGVPLASIGIVAGLLIGIAAGVLVILGGRRAGGMDRPRPPDAP